MILYQAILQTSLSWNVTNFAWLQSPFQCSLFCCNPSLGLMTNTRGCKVTGQVGDPRVTSHALGSAKNVRESTLTLPSELPRWELESQMDSWNFKERFQGKNSMACGVFYIIENPLKCRCLKWAPIAHLDIWNTSYGQKKGWESNWQFDSRPQKVENWPNLLVYRGHATYHWKALNDIYN
jgi:hypothetical protein